MTACPQPRLQSLCVFCGAATGTDPVHRDAAAGLGRILGANQVTLVFGGGRLGLMGILAQSALAAGGRVVGIIPEHLVSVEAAFDEVSELVVVDSMHTRKQKMFALADAFCVLPGGFGTLDETFEILTWKQLRLHNKPIVLCNVAGYWDKWIELAGSIVGQGFAHPDTNRLYSVVSSPEAVLPAAMREIEQAAAGATHLF